MLYSIGHSNYPIQKFIYLLKKAGVEKVYDVRSRPYCGKYTEQFSLPNLKSTLYAHGIEYSWCGKFLGGKSEVSVESPGFIESMSVVMLDSKSRDVAVVCSEKDPKNCHRASKLGAYAMRNDCKIRHLYEDLSTASQEELEAVQPDEWVWEEYGQRRQLCLF